LKCDSLTDVRVAPVLRRMNSTSSFAANASAATYGEGGRALCGVDRCWLIVLRGDGSLVLQLSQGDGGGRQIVPANQCGRPGMYRMAVQVDAAARTVQARLRRGGQDRFARTANDTTSLPEGWRFRRTEYSYFTIPVSEGGGACANRQAPPLDMTVCGLHMSAALRYADTDELLRRDNPQPTDDALRYFASEAGTMAWLPLTDNPPLEGTHTQAMLVTVQHGPAAGDAAQRSFGYFKSPAAIHGVGRPRVSAMTIRPGPRWGVGIVNWNTLDAILRDLDIRGGFYAVADLFLGAQYTFDVRDCVLSGAEAAWCGMSNIIYFRNVTIQPIGRFGILLNGSNCMMDGVHFIDAFTWRSEYCFRHIGTVMYGGMNLLANVPIDAGEASQYPSAAAFSQASIAGTRTSLTLRHLRVSNMPAQAAVLELPAYPRAAPMVLLMEDIACRGRPPWCGPMPRGGTARSEASIRGPTPGCWTIALDWTPGLSRSRWPTAKATPSSRMARYTCA